MVGPTFILLIPLSHFSEPVATIAKDPLAFMNPTATLLYFPVLDTEADESQ